MAIHNHDTSLTLQDDCPRCNQLADDPVQLDPYHLRRLWRGVVESKADLRAYNTLYAAAGLAKTLETAFIWEEHTSLNPPEKDKRIDLFKVGGDF